MRGQDTVSTHLPSGPRASTAQPQPRSRSGAGCEPNGHSLAPLTSCPLWELLPLAPTQGSPAAHLGPHGLGRPQPHQLAVLRTASREALGRCGAGPRGAPRAVDRQDGTSRGLGLLPPTCHDPEPCWGPGKWLQKAQVGHGIQTARSKGHGGAEGTGEQAGSSGPHLPAEHCPGTGQPPRGVAGGGKGHGPS